CSQRVTTARTSSRSDTAPELIHRTLVRTTDKLGRRETTETKVTQEVWSQPRATRNSFTSSLTPLRRRVPAGNQSKPAAFATASRVDSATSTVPGRAAPVTRLARLTGLPNQSPARVTAHPD